MKKLIYALIVIALLAVIGWFGYDKYYSSPEEEVVVVNENLNAIPEVDLLTYTSDNGFSFDYPTGYTVSEVIDPTVAGGYVVHIVAHNVPFPSAQITVGPVETEFSLWEGMAWEYLDEVEASFTREEEVKKYSELTNDEAQDYILTPSQEAILAIRDQDEDTLKELTHPVKGIRFSPYAYVDVNNNLVFDEFDFNSDKKYTWGNYDGRGNEISLTLSEYWDRFVFDKNFIHAEKIRNNEVVGTGNTNNNIFTVYDNAITVEYYYPGTSEYDNMDWASLIISFEKYQDEWYLVGVTHNQWTI